MATRKEMRDRFLEAADRRVNNILKNLESLGKLSNRQYYSFSEDEAKRMFERINDELNLQARKFFLKNKFTLKRKGDM